MYLESLERLRSNEFANKTAKFFETSFGGPTPLEEIADEIEKELITRYNNCIFVQESEFASKIVDWCIENDGALEDYINYHYLDKNSDSTI